MELETSNETLQPMMQSGDVQPQMTTTPIGLTALTSVIQERQVLEQHIETRTTTLLQQEVAWLEELFAKFNQMGAELLSALNESSAKRAARANDDLMKIRQQTEEMKQMKERYEQLLQKTASLYGVIANPFGGAAMTTTLLNETTPPKANITENARVEQ